MDRSREHPAATGGYKVDGNGISEAQAAAFADVNTAEAAAAEVEDDDDWPGSWETEIVHDAGPGPASQPMEKSRALPPELH